MRSGENPAKAAVVCTACTRGSLTLTHNTSSVALPQSAMTVVGSQHQSIRARHECNPQNAIIDSQAGIFADHEPPCLSVSNLRRALWLYLIAF